MNSWLRGVTIRVILLHDVWRTALRLLYVRERVAYVGTPRSIFFNTSSYKNLGHVVAQLDEALRYMPESR
jgi:hypothetical protein